MRPSSSIICSSICRRPAVSTIRISLCSCRAFSKAARAMFTGSAPLPIEKTGTPTFSPFTRNCSMAAGRYTSQAASSGLCPFAFNFPASLAAVVVLPAPWRPAIRITVMSLSCAILISVVSEPMSLISSSLTILTTCCPGVRDSSTSAPTARSSMLFTNCLTTLKFTSASRSAMRTSLSAAFVSASLSFPLPRRSRNTRCNFSVKLSNAIGFLLSAL